MSLNDTLSGWLNKTPTNQLSSNSLKNYVSGNAQTETSKIYSNAKVREFTESFGFIVYFLVACLILSTFVGEKITRYFLYIVLAGMLVSNTDKITSLLGRYNNG